MDVCCLQKQCQNPVDEDTAMVMVEDCVCDSGSSLETYRWSAIIEVSNGAYTCSNSSQSARVAIGLHVRKGDETYWGILGKFVRLNDYNFGGMWWSFYRIRAA
nr:hypothetical protein Iba_chr10bCG8420 [Ipomoea batatas]